VQGNVILWPESVGLTERCTKTDLFGFNYKIGEHVLNQRKNFSLSFE